MEFDLEYKLQLFREEQPELFDAKGKRYTGTELSNRTAEMMFELINELEGALANADTGDRQLTIPDVMPMLRDIGTLLDNKVESTDQDDEQSWDEIAGVVELIEAIYYDNRMLKRN